MSRPRRVRPKGLAWRQPRRNHADGVGQVEVMRQTKINQTNAKDDTGDPGQALGGCRFESCVERANDQCPSRERQIFEHSVPSAELGWVGEATGNVKE